jgi:cytidine deaminase
LQPLNDLELIQLAKEARERAYAPYSLYRVGACILATSGALYSGANVENQSYGGTICAERTAIGAMVMGGDLKIQKIAVSTGDGGFPCGICLQSIAEFTDDPESCSIIVESPTGIQVFSLKELAPNLWSSKLVQPKQ